MVRLTIALPDNRNTIMVDDSKSIKNIFAENNINPGAGQIMIDGCAATAEEMNSPLRELGIIDVCTVAVCTKLANA